MHILLSLAGSMENSRSLPDPAKHSFPKHDSVSHIAKVRLPIGTWIQLSLGLNSDLGFVVRSIKHVRLKVWLCIACP